MIFNLLVTVVISYVIIRLIIRYAHELKFIDVPNERSHHCNIIPRGAGIGFISAMFISIAIFEFQLFLEDWYIFMALLMVFSVGIIDDRYEVSAKLKFIVIFLATSLLWFYGVTIDTLGIWFGYEIILPSIVALVFSMFSLAGFTNALNLIDGIDGLSSTISIVILSFFLMIGIDNSNYLMQVLSLFTIASLVGFLFLNWNPAKIFMGDSGSLSLGFMISILAVLSLEYIHPVLILYLAAVPILDTLIVMTRRMGRGSSPFKPDKTHLHHILIKFFEMKTGKTVVFFAILQIIFSSIGYILINVINKDENSFFSLVAIVGFILIFIIFYMLFTGIQRRQIILDKRKGVK